MKANELMNELFARSDFSGGTCDTIKAGDPERELKKVAVTCIASVQVIKKAHEWGADLIITHEPTYYDHFDGRRDGEVARLKQELIEKTQMTIYRFHDHPHTENPDLISEGELRFLGLKGRYQNRVSLGVNRFVLDEPMTARELAKLIENKLKVAHVRICGEMDKPSTNLILGFGSAGVFGELTKDDSEIAIVGELCEWREGEYCRDAAALGINKSVLVLGHMGSERDGMHYLAEILEEKYRDSFETKYFDCQEVFSYTD